MIVFMLTKPVKEVLTMSYHDTVSALAGDAEQLEALYQSAVDAGEAEAFKQAIDNAQTGAPENLLFAAWYYRLHYAATRAKASFVAWGWAVPLAVLNGLLFWWLSDDDRFATRIVTIRPENAVEYIPMLFLLVAPLAAVFVLVYLTAAGRRDWRLSVLIGIGLVAAGGYVLWAYPRTGTRPFQEQYLTLMAIHLPLLAWAGVGAFLLAGRRDPVNRFAFLSKSLEVVIMGGLFAIAGGIFIGITFGLFAALNIDFPTVVQRLFIAGGAGLIPVLAVAVVYNPHKSPAGQSFEDGLSRLPALLTRVLLPLTLVVLLVYVAFIPFNFMEPFNNRDVLVTYNIMLFAVIALILGATPAVETGLSPRLALWLRRCIIAVAVLAVLVSVYALAAIVYRTAIDRLTPNRLAFIGWNVINIGLLLLFLFYQAKAKAGDWLPQLYRAFAAGTLAYVAWTLVMILALPWLFGSRQGALENLPVQVQSIIDLNPDPILLKCSQSPHIYLLQDGEKRWVNTIATFEDRGYVWRDVRFVTCDNLRLIPDGMPIPADAGPPPQP
jgi:hypothetical protein